MQSLEFRAMNTAILLAAEGEELAIAGLQATRSFIESSEQRFSRFLHESELSTLNRSAGQWCSISEDLMEMLTLSLRYFDETDGFFDPAILTDLKRIGYDKSIEDLHKQGDINGPLPKRAFRPSFNLIDVDLHGGRVKLPHHMEIDLGGIAKGWIAEKASNLLRSYAPICVVNAGGDICFTGTPGDGLKWRVELEDPREPAQTVGELFVGQCGMATSSVTKRTWNQNGQIRHHLIDPRTGDPAVIEWLSVTVISPNITEAEVLAKSILIGGENEARNLALRFPDLAYICIDKSGQISGSEIGMELLNDYEYIDQ